MCGVFVAPLIKRREHEQPGILPAHLWPAGRAAAIMGAVVKDDEHPDQEPGRRDHEGHGQQRRDVQR